MVPPIWYILHTSYILHTYILHTYIYTYYIHTFILHTYMYIHTYIHTYILHTYYIHTYTHTLGRGPNSELRKRMTIMTMTEEMNPTSCVFPPVASWSTVRLSAPAVGKLPKKAPPRFITP